MPDINVLIEKGLHIINPYLNEKYFLYLMGSIFLLGIVGQTLTGSIYGRLIKKAKNMLTTENKTLKKIKIKYENYAALNGTVTNSEIMVRQYINRHKIIGIPLRDIKKISDNCALLAITVSAIVSIMSYVKGYENMTIISYGFVGCFVAYALGIYEKSQGVETKFDELICMITDFLENTLSSKGLRQERTNRTLRQQIETEESKEKYEETISQQDKLVENYQQKVFHLNLESLDEESDDEMVKQEKIINEVLAEFLY